MATALGCVPLEGRAPRPDVVDAPNDLPPDATVDVVDVPSEPSLPDVTVVDAPDVTVVDVPDVRDVVDASDAVIAADAPDVVDASAVPDVTDAADVTDVMDVTDVVDVVDAPEDGGGLSATPDLTPRFTWPMSVTATSARLDEEGRFLLSAGAADNADRDLALTRLTGAGARDPFPTADANGFVRVVARRDTVRLVAVPRAMAIDRMGRVVTVGAGLGSGRRYGLVARWLATGALDASFGGGGVALVEYPPGSPPRDLVLRAVALDDAGGMLVAGGDVGPLDRSTLGVYARLTADGRVDAAFGGVAVDTRVAAFSAALRDGDGWALAGDGARDGAPMVLYLGADGAARADVGERGMVTHTASGAAPMVVRAAVRDVDGGIVVAGGAGAQVWNRTPLQLVRFSARRAPDVAWGRAGLVAGFSSAVWNFEMCHAGALVPWSQGSHLVLGQDGLGYRLHRVLRDGTVDRAFGRDGSLSELPAAFQFVFEMLPDGRGGLWVLYRAGMEREVGATHYPPAR